MCATRRIYMWGHTAHDTRTRRLCMYTCMHIYIHIYSHICRYIITPTDGIICVYHCMPYLYQSLHTSMAWSVHDTYQTTTYMYRIYHQICQGKENSTYTLQVVVFLSLSPDLSRPLSFSLYAYNTRRHQARGISLSMSCPNVCVCVCVWCVQE